MTATDELRAMLDERGMEYETDDAKVSDSDWYRVTYVKEKYGKTWVYEEPPDCCLLISYSHDLGAEEAIAATLGVESDTGEYERNTDGSYKCPICGCVVDYDIRGDDERIITMDDYVIPFNHCPKCGAEVADE